MRILIYHPVRLPVQYYGGTERVMFWLAKGLKKLGHQVGFVAAPGSQAPDGITCLTDPMDVIRYAKEWDILHGFTRPSADMVDAYQGRSLTTIHGNGQVGEKFDRNTVFLSKNHAIRHGATCYVYNGLDPDELTFSSSPRRNRFLFLSKTNWKVKNLRKAVSLCSTHQQNLWIAGGNGPVDLRFRVGTKSLFSDWNWAGSIDQAAKAKFLTEGRALLFPIIWNEPFGLVMMESLLSGTPVLAHPHGSVPELLEFAPECWMRSDEDWKNALTGNLRFPAASICRDWAAAKFNLTEMARSYVTLYERVLRGELLNSSVPETKIAATDIRQSLQNIR
jgi:glycosyltransferase involved in cell wall biosynthesis